MQQTEKLRVMVPVCGGGGGGGGEGVSRVYDLG